MPWNWCGVLLCPEVAGAVRSLLGPAFGLPILLHNHRVTPANSPAAEQGWHHVRLPPLPCPFPRCCPHPTTTPAPHITSIFINETFNTYIYTFSLNYALPILAPDSQLALNCLLVCES